MDRLRIAGELLEMAREIVSVSIREKEFDDRLGRRWVLDSGDYAGYIREIEGPGIPLYIVSVLFPNGNEYRLKGLEEKLSVAKKGLKKLLNALESDASGGVIMTDWVKV